MSTYTDAFWTRVLALAETLDALSYYHLLDVAPSATTATVEEAYYRRARNIHPDRHGYQTDPAATRALVRLYARFGEAFRVLRSPELRRAYDQELAAGRVRLSEEARQRYRVQMEAPDPRTEHATKLLNTAREQARAGNVSGALAGLKLAAQFEPESKAIQREIARWEREAAGAGEAAR
ncbi:MAG: J domain-containing protein [Myxococcota bacterium]